MCGIVGIALRGSDPDRELLRRMRDVLRHRGPDDAGEYVADGIGLGHRRLSIVDIGGGHQPMFNEDGQVCVIFNGEIYNHAEYRAELREKGHVYRTNSDTEAILHLYEEHGLSMLEKLRGMFAFAVWDGRKKELVLARDRLGVKPLYYAHLSDGTLYFASEIKALLETGIPRVLNRRALPDYLANHATSGPETLFHGIKRLAPGHFLVWRDGRVKVQKYWDVPTEASTAVEEKSSENFVRQWKDLFYEAVRIRLMADVPLGTFLSGGIDSSAITAAMSSMVAGRLKTFSVAFLEREANELEYARLVARKFNTDHHEVIVSSKEFFDQLPKLVWHEDEPLAHPSSVALYFVSELASQHVKVVLTGEGSDEVLGGYGRYKKTLLNFRAAKALSRFTSRSMREGLRRALASGAVPNRFLQKLERTFLMREASLDELYFDNFAVFSQREQKQLLSREFQESVVVDPYAEMHLLLDGVKEMDLLQKILYLDLHVYLHELLMKQDQMSMAASIESRVPFLDHRLVEFSAQMPNAMKIRGSSTKYVLRESMKGILPPEILNRPKMGFPVPIAKWFREGHREIVEEYVTSRRALDRGIFDPGAVKELVASHMSGKRNNAQKIWSLANLEIWHRQFLDC